MQRRLVAMVGVLALAAPSLPARGAGLPEPPNTEPSVTRPLPPAEAAAGFRVPEGFRVNVFAAEPEVRNPVALAWDTRGRLWVAENYTYSDATDRFDLRLRDRVLIFEDTDADGRFDRRVVFTEDVQRLGSVELGYGGVWLLCPPQLLFVPDRNYDDVPDGPPEVMLDGFHVAIENHHTFANGLRWGPDGWLYGRCGASSPGQVGVPGTPEAERIPLRGGVWRYHPGCQRFEVLCHGTTNPWGHDWDALGEGFFINTVNGHLWHMIPGAHFVRPHTIEPNPRAYALIDQHADHYHWDNTKEIPKQAPTAGSDNDRHGGGHAHVGLMIYQGDQWPEPYRGKLFTLNLHGRRMNVERLERAGSGFVGRHEPDAFFASDPWFRGIDLSCGPDGSVFVLDWSDTGECHEHEGVHRTSGRIYRIACSGNARPNSPPYEAGVGRGSSERGAASGSEPSSPHLRKGGNRTENPVRDVGTLSEHQLVRLHQHRNEWFARQARRVLAERATRGDPLIDAKVGLRRLADEDPDVSHKVRALCSLFVVSGVNPEALLAHEHEAVRAWGVRFLTDALPIDTIYSRRGGPDVALPAAQLDRLAGLAKHDPSGLVRLVLASALQRLPVPQRVTLARALGTRSEDAGDHNIPALVWTSLIPVADADPDGLVALAADCRLPTVVRLIARRLGEDIEARPAPLNGLLDLAARQPAAFQAQVVAGLGDALSGWRKAAKPPAWDRLEPAVASASDPAVRTAVRDLSVLFGDGRALADVKRVALDESAPIDARKAALKTLIDSRAPDLRAICEKLVRVRFLNAVAVRGLALFDDPAIGRTLAANYRSFHPSERPAALDTLASRPAFARALLDQVAAGTIPRREITAFHARQIRSLGDPVLVERLVQVWGELRESAADRRERIAALKQALDASTLAGADRSHGRAVFDRVCGSCHKLYGYGGDVGPDLTGAGRDNLDYLLENLVDPSASVSADFRMLVVAMQDGRVLNGLVRAQTDRTLTLQTQNERLVLDRAEIEAIKPSSLSLMPEGLLDPLTPAEVRDLIAYLSGRTQVPLPKAP